MADVSTKSPFCPAGKSAVPMVADGVASADFVLVLSDMSEIFSRVTVADPEATILP